MTRASACGSSWLSVESRRVALATIATPSRADAPRRRPVAAVRHATAAEAPATHWAGRQKARAALASATRLMSESDRASFAAYDVEFVVEISRCRAPLHRSTTEALSPAADVELYSSTALQSALHLYSSTALYTLHPLHPPSAQGRDGRTVHRHHTGISRWGQCGASRHLPLGACLFLSLFAVCRRFSLQPSCHPAVFLLSSFSLPSLLPLSLHSPLPRSAAPLLPVES